MKILKPPVQRKFNDKKSIFLAGSIDNGAADDWQVNVSKSLSDLDIYVLNPRRDEWDKSWEQTIDNPKFKEQVLWELEGLENVDVVLFNFLGNSKAPISLLELGLCAKKSNVVVCCEPGYWRKGNIQVVCEQFELPLVDHIDDAVLLLRELLS